MASVGLDEEQIEQNSNMVKVFGVTLVLEFVMALFMALFFFGDPATASAINAGNGALYGFLTGFAWVAMAMGVNAMFEQRSFTYIAIVGGY
jgi:membrane-associated HD superfamily phosphohydrolase